MAYVDMGIDEHLDEIRELNRSVKPAAADEKMRALLHSLGPEDLRFYEPDLRKALESFLPKRKKSLLRELERLLARGMSSSRLTPEVFRSEPTPARPAKIDIPRFERDLKERLQILSDRYLFQWATHYRDTIAEVLDRATKGASSGTQELIAISAIIKAEAAYHSHEIFSKGFSYQIGRLGHSRDFAVTKSLNGLQRFLELPVDYLSSRISGTSRDQEVLAVRQLSSAFLAGILLGYSDVETGEEPGWQLLPESPRSWIQSLGFVLPVDLEAILLRLNPNWLIKGLAGVLQPCMEALCGGPGDRTNITNLDLPTLCHFRDDLPALALSIPLGENASRPLLELVCLLGQDALNRRILEATMAEGVDLLIGFFPPDLREWLKKSPELDSKIVDLSAPPKAEEDQATRSERIRDRLVYIRYSLVVPSVASSPLTVNFARAFPVQDLSRAAYYHVFRKSVRELLRTLERRNGVRLWCSLRRSGKTTACRDLGSATGHSQVLVQSCDNTDPRPLSSVLWNEVLGAIQSRSALAPAFLEMTIEKCSDEGPDQGRRYILIIDEYERLFGLLDSVARRDEELKYTLALPLLSQLVQFSNQHLIVLLGQQPDAHFIQMDFNQLSAYVEQDDFPLFPHERGSPSEEFSELLGKIMTGRVRFDSGFADALFEETGGHPYLCAKVIIVFFDWLISKKRRISELHFSAQDFSDFAESHLTPIEIQLNPEYGFFRKAASEATGREGKEQSPWLYSVYSMMREICRESPDTFSCTRSEFRDLFGRLELESLGIGDLDLLSTSTRANFFEQRGNQISPRVRLLGRIAAASTPKVSP